MKILFGPVFETEYLPCDAIEMLYMVDVPALLLPIERQAVHVFLAHDVRENGRRRQTPGVDRFWRRRGHDGRLHFVSFAVAAAVHLPEMPDYLDLRRYNGNFTARFGAHLVQRTAAASADLLAFLQRMHDRLHRQIREVVFPFAGLLAAFVGDPLHLRLFTGGVARISASLNRFNSS